MKFYVVKNDVFLTQERMTEYVDVYIELKNICFEAWRKHILQKLFFFSISVAMLNLFSTVFIGFRHIPVVIYCFFQCCFVF